MNTIAFRCPGCGRDVELDEERVGCSVRCAVCGTPVRFAATPVARGAASALRRADSVVAASANAAPPRRLSLGRILLAGILGGVLLGSLVFGVLWASYFAPSEIDGDLAYLPDDCEVVVSVHVNEILSSDARVEFVSRVQDRGTAQVTNLDREFGLGNEDIVRYTVGGRLEQQPADRVAVVHTRKQVPIEEVWAAWQVKDFKGKPVGRHTLYTSETNGRAVAAPETNVLVYGSPDRLRSILARDRKAYLSPGLKPLLERADFSQSVVNVVNLENHPQAALQPSLNHARIHLDNYLGLPTWNPVRSPQPPTADGLQIPATLKVRGLVQQARITWAIEETLILRLASKDDADLLEELLQKQLEGLLDSTNHGIADPRLRTLSASAHGDETVLEYRYRPLAAEDFTGSRKKPWPFAPPARVGPPDRPLAPAAPPGAEWVPPPEAAGGGPVR